MHGVTGAASFCTQKSIPWMSIYTETDHGSEHNMALSANRAAHQIDVRAHDKFSWANRLRHVHQWRHDNHTVQRQMSRLANMDARVKPRKMEDGR